MSEDSGGGGAIKLFVLSRRQINIVGTLYVVVKTDFRVVRKSDNNAVTTSLRQIFLHPHKVTIISVPVTTLHQE